MPATQWHLCRLSKLQARRWLLQVSMFPLERVRNFSIIAHGARVGRHRCSCNGKLPALFSFSRVAAYCACSRPWQVHDGGQADGNDRQDAGARSLAATARGPLTAQALLQAPFAKASKHSTLTSCRLSESVASPLRRRPAAWFTVMVTLTTY